MYVFSLEQTLLAPIKGPLGQYNAHSATAKQMNNAAAFEATEVGQHRNAVVGRSLTHSLPHYTHAGPNCSPTADCTHRFLLNNKSNTIQTMAKPIPPTESTVATISNHRSTKFSSKSRTTPPTFVQ